MAALRSPRGGGGAPDFDSLNTPNVLTTPVMISSGASSANKDKDDLLSTPTLLTPRILGPMSTSANGESWSLFSPKLTSAGGFLTGSRELREHPPDLPLDSGIGLRSPNDGVLAKRRKLKQQSSGHSRSIESDSNSCDTPDSNQPKDLSISHKKRHEEGFKEFSIRPGSREEPHDKQLDSQNSANQPTDLSMDVKREISLSSRRGSHSPGGGSPCRDHMDSVRDRVGAVTISSSPKWFKHPASRSMPEKLAGSELHHPSPLTVPSPNWTAISAFMTGEALKTPKVLDNFVFDVLPPNTPSTPTALFGAIPTSLSYSRATIRDKSPESNHSAANNSTSPGGTNSLSLTPPPPYPEDLSVRHRSTDEQIVVPKRELDDSPSMGRARSASPHRLNGDIKEEPRDYPALPPGFPPYYLHSSITPQHIYGRSRNSHDDSPDSGDCQPGESSSGRSAHGHSHLNHGEPVSSSSFGQDQEHSQDSLSGPPASLTAAAMFVRHHHQQQPPPPSGGSGAHLSSPPASPPSSSSGVHGGGGIESHQPRYQHPSHSHQSAGHHNILGGGGHHPNLPQQLSSIGNSNNVGGPVHLSSGGGYYHHNGLSNGPQQVGNQVLARQHQQLYNATTFGAAARAAAASAYDDRHHINNGGHDPSVPSSGYNHLWSSSAGSGAVTTNGGLMTAANNGGVTAASWTMSPESGHSSLKAMNGGLSSSSSGPGSGNGGQIVIKTEPVEGSPSGGHPHHMPPHHGGAPHPHYHRLMADAAASPSSAAMDASRPRSNDNNNDLHHQQQRQELLTKQQQFLMFAAASGGAGSNLSPAAVRGRKMSSSSKQHNPMDGMSPHRNGGLDRRDEGMLSSPHHAGHSDAEGGPTPAKRRGKAGGKAAAGGKNSNKGGGENGGQKRVFVCPHCQRSYDWNYNLNRHLKYECGKENAFMCSKCGRKFPHKQNCVYHLKRKHKIVCETVDQYVSRGLVIYQGSDPNAGNNPSASPRSAVKGGGQTPVASPAKITGNRMSESHLSLGPGGHHHHLTGGGVFSPSSGHHMLKGERLSPPTSFQDSYSPTGSGCSPTPSHHSN